MLANGYADHRDKADDCSSEVGDYKNDLRRLKQDVVDDLSRKMDDFIERSDYSHGTNNVLMATLYSRNHPTEMAKRRRKDDGELPEKQFVMRNSVLTDLFTCKHIESIENIVIAALFLWITATAVADFLATRSLSSVLPGPSLVQRAFVNYQTGIYIWMQIKFLAILAFPLTLFWAKYRENSRLISPENADRLFMVCYCAYQLFILYLPYSVIFAEPILGRATASAVVIEQIRLMLKIHSFFREVTKKMRRASASKAKKTDGDEPASNSTTSMEFPSFTLYLYFLFAPTLIYRDVYPQTNSIDWHYVVSNFAQFTGCILLAYYVMARYLQPQFVAHPPNTLTPEMLINTVFTCILPGTVVIVVGFFGFLHCWLNAWAEMLRFGDRLFYKDWWNSASFGEYYRTWNCVVQDWLYTYIYKDSQDVFKCDKAISAFMVFLISALTHEYIIVSTLNFFFPFLFFEFGAAGFFIRNFKSESRLSNIVVWALFTFGVGMITSFYTYEMLSRSMCPGVYDNFLLNAVVPRVISCMESGAQ